MADSVIKDRHGIEAEYAGVTKVKLNTVDGGKQYFSEGEAIEGVEVSLDFSNGDQTVTAPDGKLVKSAIIKKPDTLVPENIAKDVDVAGIVGTHEGGGVPRLKPIRFYDPYGNVLYSFTRAEIKEMTELPPGPELGDLTFSKWTHTLAELQAVPYFADVGPCYTQNGSDVLVLIVDVYYYLNLNTSPSLTLCFNAKSEMKVNWGDGTTETQPTQYYMSHTYTTAGRKIITIQKAYASVKKIQLGWYSSYYYPFVSYSNNTYIGGGTSIGGNNNEYAISILNGINIPVELVSCVKNAKLKMLSSVSDLSITGQKGLAADTSLEFICAKNISIGTAYACARCLSLKRIPNITKITYNSAFDECPSLEELVFGATPDKLTDMNNRWAMLMTQTEPPTLTADTVRTWGTKPIYVPDSAVEAYKTADVWSTVAGYIYPASQYPD